MKFPSAIAFSLALGLAFTPFASADEAHHAPVATTVSAEPSASPSASAADDARTEGEVKKVDKDTGKITIKHGELKMLEMPPMTMIFRVTEPAMLEQVKAGDKVSFVADKINGRFTVTDIEVVN